MTAATYQRLDYGNLTDTDRIITFEKSSGLGPLYFLAALFKELNYISAVIEFSMSPYQYMKCVIINK